MPRQILGALNGGYGATDRRDKLTPGATHMATMGPYTNIASIRNVGPSQVQLSLSW